MYTSTYILFQFFQEYVQCTFNQAHYDDDCLISAILVFSAQNSFQIAFINLKASWQFFSSNLLSKFWKQIAGNFLKANRWKFFESKSLKNFWKIFESKSLGKFWKLFESISLENSWKQIAGKILKASWRIFSSDLLSKFWKLIAG